MPPDDDLPDPTSDPIEPPDPMQLILQQLARIEQQLQRQSPSGIPRDPSDEQGEGDPDREAVQALVGPLLSHFQEAVDSGEILFAAVTVVRNPAYAQTIPFLPRPVDEPPSPDDEARRAHAVYFGAHQFGKSHALFSRRTQENLRRTLQPPGDA